MCVCFFGQASPTVGLLCSHVKNSSCFNPVEFLCEIFYLQQFTSCFFFPPLVHIGSVL